jgi:hypothetical protein
MPQRFHAPQRCGPDQERATAPGRWPIFFVRNLHPWVALRPFRPTLQRCRKRRNICSAPPSAARWHAPHLLRVERSWSTWPSRLSSSRKCANRDYSAPTRRNATVIAAEGAGSDFAGYKPKLSRRCDGADHHHHRLRSGSRHRFLC